MLLTVRIRSIYPVTILSKPREGLCALRSPSSADLLQSPFRLALKGGGGATVVHSGAVDKKTT